MRIERIGLSLESIAEERRREHREHPDEEHPFATVADDDALPQTAPITAAQPEPLDPAEVMRRNDPTARLRVDAHEEPPKRNLTQAIAAFTNYDPPPHHELAETDL